MKVKKIDKDEKHDLEFKQNWRDEYLKWICAFANTHGGSLYIGVKDNGEICGVKDYRKLSEDIPNKILQAMGLICEVNLLDEGGKKYFRIDVEKYPFPVSYHGKYYKRSGSTTQEVVDNDSIKLFKKMALDHNRLDSKALDVTTAFIAKKHSFFRRRHSASCF